MRDLQRTALLASVALAACHADLRADHHAPSPRVILQESFDGREGEQVFRHWLADAPAASKSAFTLSEGHHGHGLRLVTDEPPDRSVRMFRTVDAAPLRGMRLRLSADARLAPHDLGRGEVRISISRPHEISSGWDLASGAVRGHGYWSPVAAVIDVPGDATSIEISVVARGTTDVTFDDLRLEASAAPPDSTASLRPEQRDRLVTLIQLIGYLRFFYPSDAAAETDWTGLEIEAVDRMLAAQDAADARRQLAALLDRIATDAALHPEGTPPPPAPPAPPAAMLTRWIHVGLGGGEPYWSFRTGLDEPPATGIHIALRRSLAEIGACKRAVAQILVERTEGQPAVELEIAPLLGNRPQPKTAVVDARQSSVETDLPAEVHGVSFGAFVRGFGSVDISGIRLSCDGRPAAEIRADSNVLVSGAANHLYTLARNHACGPRTCLHIERRPLTELTTDDILDVSIGQGIRLRMPVVAWTDGKHTIPRRAPPAVEVQLPASARASRLAAVLDLWIMLRWFYPYFADERIDWSKAIAPALDEAARAATSDAQRHALSQLTAALHDDHARVIRPGIDDGLLPVLFRSLDDKIVVAATLSPAGDIPIGSTVIAIDGVPAIEARRRAAELMSAATPAFALRHSTYSLAYGHKGALSSITFREPGGTRDVTRWIPHLDRGELVPKLREPRPISGAELAKGVVYIDLHTLTEATWASVLPRLVTSSAIIFDLRGYVGPAAFVPLGHLTDRETRSPTFLVPLVSPTGTQGYEQSFWYTPPRKPTLHARAIFLADARTASAPETILQIVRGERLGIILGEPTGGTNGNVIDYDLIGGMAMRFTGLRVLNHDGTILQGHGITPDVVVHPTAAGIAAGRDEILDAAVELAAQGPAGGQPYP